MTQLSDLARLARIALRREPLGPLVIIGFCALFWGAWVITP